MFSSFYHTVLLPPISYLCVRILNQSVKHIPIIDKECPAQHRRRRSVGLPVRINPTLIAIPQPEEGSVQCEICHAIIARRQDFPRHMRIHSDKRDEM